MEIQSFLDKHLAVLRDLLFSMYESSPELPTETAFSYRAEPRDSATVPIFIRYHTAYHCPSVYIGVTFHPQYFRNFVANFHEI
jgi:hypothetical protein